MDFPARAGQNGSSGCVALPPFLACSRALIERYNRTVRYDWLAHHLFDSIDEVQDFATRWLWTYNHERPNTAIDGLTPKQKLAMVA